uniref:Endonuclease/exonuclease/phosphatase domain-containing protein n=1 Tax=Salarias fasciatus TaxID=181472 RepID=A0A672HJK1_SALFA
MLTRNIDVQSGLVNGSFGTLVRCISENDHVTKLGLRMDSHVSSEQNDDVVYIQREEDNLKQKGVVRRQFPIKLAFACTIHKVQGMSMQSAVVSLKNIFEPGMAYVAVSRVTSLGGLYIVDMDESKFYASQQITAALESMRQASPAEMMPLLQMRETLSRPDTLTIIHHNTEGLPAHINDIKSHHEMCLADILCLTETHLQGSFVADSLQLPGYNLFRRNRHLSYSNFPQIASRGGGGVAIYVRNHIQAREKQYLLNVTDLEFVALKLDAPVSAIIAAVYRPPNYDVTSFLANLSSLLDSLEILDCQPIIVCGDFNENLSSTAKKPILELFQTRGYAQLITASTTEKNTLLDLIFISQRDHCVQSGVLRTYYSYHDPVYCVLTFSNV